MYLIYIIYILHIIYTYIYIYLYIYIYIYIYINIPIYIHLSFYKQLGSRLNPQSCKVADIFKVFGAQSCLMLFSSNLCLRGTE